MLANKTKTEKRMVILLGVVAIVNFIVNIIFPIIIYDKTVATVCYNLVFDFRNLAMFSIVFEILIVAVLILMIRKLRSKMLTKTEKRMVILLGGVVIVNFIVNIIFPMIISPQANDPFTCSRYVPSLLLLTAFGIIFEILIVAVLILMIRKE